MKIKTWLDSNSISLKVDTLNEGYLTKIVFTDCPEEDYNYYVPDILTGNLDLSSPIFYEGAGKNIPNAIYNLFTRMMNEELVAIEKSSGEVKRVEKVPTFNAGHLKELCDYISVCELKTAEHA